MKIVKYTAQEGADAAPAIVLREWEDGTFQLYVLNFEAASHIRAAHPSQIEVIFDPAVFQEVLDDLQATTQRLTEVEVELESLRQEIRRYAPHQTPPSQAPSSQIGTATEVETVDEAQLPESDDELQLATGDVDSTPKKKKAAWPR